MSHLSDFSNKQKSELRAVSADRARHILLKYGYRCSSFEMPEYFEISGLDKMSLEPISDFKSIFITKPLDVITPKGPATWRRFSFIHPYTYWHIVDTLTKPSNWKLIKALLCNPNSKVAVYSLPIFAARSRKQIQRENIMRSIRMSEIDIQKDSLQYKYIGVTDIQNFYSSIYTHSIAWALHSKQAAWKDKKYLLLGRQLDRLFQSSRDRQTNGIPTGSLVSDIIAELICAKIDVLVTRALKKRKIIKKVQISRFRDDYRVLANSEEHIRDVFRILNRTLQDNFDLSLNPQKTEIFNDPLQYGYRPWIIKLSQNSLLRSVRYAEEPHIINFDYLRDILLEAYRLQKEFPNGRPAVSIMSSLITILERYPNKISLKDHQIINLIVILRKIILSREEATPSTIIIMEILMHRCKPKVKSKILREMIDAIKGSEDAEYQAIWIYRLCKSQAQKLCAMVTGIFPTCSLVNLAHNCKVHDKKSYMSAFSMSLTNSVSLSLADATELEKFKFIHLYKFKMASGKRIRPTTVNPFGSLY